ncbi:hypothetical protein [Paractinoplanes ferrugineus]|nr:hypothetical protein [Actinoplanes ferrugineus]
MGAPLQTWPTVALIGHPAYLLEPPARRWVHRELLQAALRLRDTHGMTCGLSGMTRGPGLWWADAVRRAHVDLRLHLPYLRQADDWPDADRAEWIRLVGQASRAPLVYGATPQPRTLTACHHALIDAADELLVVWLPGARGQVADAVRYALTRGRRPTWIDPMGRRIHRPAIGDWQALFAIAPEPTGSPRTGSPQTSSPQTGSPQTGGAPTGSAQAEARSARNRRDDPAEAGRVANASPFQPKSRRLRAHPG